MRVRALTCGWLTGPAALFLDGAGGALRVPVPSLLIEHPRGTVVFDTGMHPVLGTDPASRLGPQAALWTVELGAGEDVAGRLAAAGTAADRVDFVIASHLHFDHAGGLALLPQATLVVQRREWEAANDADLAAQSYLARADWDHGHARRLVDGEHDLFGDGRVVCVPTHGHTPGHQSLRLRLDDGRDVLFTADACYLRESLVARRLPAFGHDPAAMRAVLDRFDALAAGGTELVFGHDAEQWPQVAARLG
ncbi:MAG: N-acyl homoserine lactonase family protein [bacterium]|nr:N-acyl homoserine lactonase family protein [bacterium]